MKKFYLSVFLLVFSFLIPFFAATPTPSDSGSSLAAPTLEFKSWRAGRGDANAITFITSTERTCWVLASVGYTGNLNRNTTAPIKPETVTWAFEMTHDITLASTPSTSWTGNHPAKLNSNTAFWVLAQLSVPEHESTSSCTSNIKRRDRTPVHRDGKPMEITITFTGKYEGGTVELEKKLKQDEIDMIRQIHVDMNRKIPARTEFDADGGKSDTVFNNFGKSFYDFGHYEKLIYKSLKANHQKWISKINEDYRQPKRLSNLTIGDLVLTSGYRDPHHNDYHAGSTALLSPHTWGYCLGC